MGFSDPCIARLWNVDERAVWNLRMERGVMPVYTHGGHLRTPAHYIPYFYSTY